MYFSEMHALTPNYASPNVLQGQTKINYYLEDVFSLGLTFLQMAKVMKESELEKFRLNDEVEFEQLPEIITKSGIKMEDYKAMGKA